MAWTIITDPEVAPGAPGTTALFTALRDNLAATAGGEAGAPRVLADLSFLGRAVASNDTTIEFTTFDAAKYDSYMFTFQNVEMTVDSRSLTVRTSTDGGVSFDSGASDYYSLSTNVRPTLTTTIGTHNRWITLSDAAGTASGEEGISGSLSVFGAGLSKRTSIIFASTTENASGIETYTSGKGVRLSSADVDAIQFASNEGNLASGVITMYGLRN